MRTSRLLLNFLWWKTARAADTTLAEQLSSLSFHNEGLLRRGTQFEVATIPCGYLEPENVTTPQHAWAVRSRCPFLFTKNKSDAPSVMAAKVSSDPDGLDGLDGLVPPPLGIRSAVPLGGIGAGSFELRGDGTLQQFTIWNNFPAGAPKFWAFPDALFGLKVSGQPAVALQTAPPAGILGVAALKYSGAYPVSRLIVEDEHMQTVKASLFGYH